MTTPYYEYALCHTLGPGGKVEVATINSNERLTVRYTDPINEPLSPYVMAPGSILTASSANEYLVGYMVESGVGTLYLVSNYSTPVQVTALVHVGPSPYSTTAMFFAGVMFPSGHCGYGAHDNGCCVETEKEAVMRSL